MGSVKKWEVFSKECILLGLTEAEGGVRETSEGCKVGRLWKQIWQLGVARIVKHFLWKAVSNTLPTRLNLFKRRVIEDPMCPVCKREAKLVAHVLWSCPAIGDVWA